MNDLPENTDLLACGPKQIAYDLWCLQEDRLRAGEPLESIATLVRALRERNPQLEDAAVKQGVTLFLARQFADNAARRARRQRLIFYASLAPVPAWPVTSSSGGTGVREN